MNDPLLYQGPQLTKREYFAIHAPMDVYDLSSIKVWEARTILGLRKDEQWNDRIHGTMLVAAQAVTYADALIAELRKIQSPQEEITREILDKVKCVFSDNHELKEYIEALEDASKPQR